MPKKTKFIVNSGDKFGWLTVIKELPQETRNGHLSERIFSCLCECGSIKAYRLVAIKHGGTKSCGCRRSFLLSKKTRSRGEYKTRLYRLWNRIKMRCTNPNFPNYEFYGGRGICLYEGWLTRPTAFIDYCKTLDGWDNPSLQIDRIDVNGDYTPNNIRFTTCTIQAINRRKARNNTSGYVGVTYDKDSQCYVSAIGINYKWVRIGRFNTAEEAVLARNNYILENNLSEFKIQKIITF